MFPTGLQFEFPTGLLFCKHDKQGRDSLWRLGINYFLLVVSEIDVVSTSHVLNTSSVLWFHIQTCLEAVVGVEDTQALMKKQLSFLHPQAVDRQTILLESVILHCPKMNCVKGREFKPIYPFFNWMFVYDLRVSLWVELLPHMRRSYLEHTAEKTIQTQGVISYNQPQTFSHVWFLKGQSVFFMSYASNLPLPRKVDQCCSDASSVRVP